MKASILTLHKGFFSLALIIAFLAPGIARAEMISMPVVKLQSLDKATARTMTFEARVGSTVKFGPIYIRVQACRKAPPIEKPESASFLQIWEVTPKGESRWIYSGWMFASSPALSPMDHPIYDVWVLDCLERKSTDPVPEVKAEEPKPAIEGETAVTEVPAEKPAPAQPKKDKPVVMNPEGAIMTTKETTDGEVTGEEAEPPATNPPDNAATWDIEGENPPPKEDGPVVTFPTEN